MPQRHRESQTRWFVLTGHTDQGHPEKQIEQPAPALRHPGHEGRDDDLSRHVELHGVGEENPKGEEQLDSLVQPAKDKDTVRQALAPAPATSTAESRRRMLCKDFCESVVSTPEHSLRKLGVMHLIHKDLS